MLSNNVEQVFDFTTDQLLGIEDWRKFYAKGGDEFKYHFIGYLTMDNETDGTLHLTPCTLHPTPTYSPSQSLPCPSCLSQPLRHLAPPCACTCS